MSEPGMAALEARIERIERQLGDTPIEHAFDRSVMAIVRHASALTGVATSEIVGASRDPNIVQARFAAIWVARRTHNYSMGRIGRPIGRRDHTTILNAIRRSDQLRDSDTDFRALTDRLLAAFAAPRPAQAEFPA